MTSVTSKTLMVYSESTHTLTYISTMHIDGRKFYNAAKEKTNEMEERD